MAVPAGGSGPGAGPLAGILVVDLSRALAGPQAAMLLGDLGARVIKIENPNGGDDTRGWGPPFVKAGGGVAEPGETGDFESTYFFSCNRNKESVTTDLKSDEGKDLLTRLVRQADVVVENFRTGVLDRLGFSMKQLHAINPRLVVLSITGFGHDGPEGGRAGYDQIAQGEGGLMSLTGTGPDDPTRVGVPIGDLLAGMYGAYGVVAALHERAETGRGSVVRTSLLAAIVGTHAFQGTRYTVTGEVPYGQGNHHPSICPYGLFHCKDGLVQIAVGSQGLWRRFASEFELPLDGPGFATNAERVRSREAVNGAIDAAFAAYPLDTLLPRLDEIGVPAGEVRTLDRVYDWEQTRSQGLLIEVDHATAGPIQLPGPALRFDGSSPVEHTAPPTLGQHDDSVRRWLDEAEGA
ncbi:MAG: CoA transferase [Nocardioidaceae bacterium]|nr:CoA transferase [Nocardioidaceae bacterium]